MPDILPAADTAQREQGVVFLEPGPCSACAANDIFRACGCGTTKHQYRQQLALFGLSSLFVARQTCARELLLTAAHVIQGSWRQMQNIIVFQMCMPIWKRWLDTAVLAQALELDAGEYLADQAEYQRAKWIPQRNDWVDPLKDRQAEKLAVDAGFKSRSDVVEAEGSDPEENDQRIAADHAREERLGLDFPVVSSTKITLKPETSDIAPAEEAPAPDDAEEADQQRQAAEDAEDAECAI